MKYVCDVCGYVYDPEIGDPDNGVDAGTAWEDVPEDWVCPLCGVGKDEFSAEELLSDWQFGGWQCLLPFVCTGVNYEKIDFVECKRTSCLCYKGL